jgi:hypothetical protein
LKAITDLKSRVIQVPMAHTDPTPLIDDDHCPVINLVILSDACNTGVGVCLWSVKRPDASLVTNED